CLDEDEQDELMRGEGSVGHVEDSTPGLPVDRARERELELGPPAPPFGEELGVVRRLGDHEPAQRRDVLAQGEARRTLRERAQIAVEILRLAEELLEQ